MKRKRGIPASKWGAGDELGAGNYVSTSKVVSAARLVKEGRIHSLDHVLQDGIPTLSFHGPFLYGTFRRHADSLRMWRTKNKVGAMNVRLEIADHTGTHIDALNHTSMDGVLYNGLIADEITGTHGTTKLGIEKMPPIVTRGVLIDIASLNGVERLEPQHSISKEEVISSLEESNLKLEEGDAVLIATGWSQLWLSDNEKYLKSCPGLGMSAALWLASQGVSVIGADNWNVEVTPCQDPDEVDAIHQLLIVKKGIRLIENMNLEELRREKVKEFLFACMPLHVLGGTGSPITPVAIT